MISVALNWIYLFVTIFLTGVGLCAVFDRLFWLPYPKDM